MIQAYFYKKQFMEATAFYFWLSQQSFELMPVVPFNAQQDKLLAMDFTQSSTTLTDDIINDTTAFTQYIEQQLSAAGATYGIGGYNEHRTVYARSRVFDGVSETDARCIHLGVDIWGKAGTPVAAPLDGTVHSFAFNEAYGDYGATIILEHQINGAQFYTLYGHLSLADIANLKEGDFIAAGKVFAHFGEPAENGQWPPHLHFQIILDMQGKKGDYPGVCSIAERENYLQNCPDPDALLNMIQWAQPAL